MNAQQRQEALQTEFLAVKENLPLGYADTIVERMTEQQVKKGLVYKVAAGNKYNFHILKELIQLAAEHKLEQEQALEIIRYLKNEENIIDKMTALEKRLDALEVT